jgi:Uma2 family endonuclease
VHAFSSIAPEEFRPLKRAEYDRLVALGVFEDERVELLNGILVAMSPQETPHSYSVRWLINRLAPAIVGRALLQAQQPFAASEDSEPEPDISVVPIAAYLDGHPKTALLVIEVADSSVRKDLEVKPPLYAAAGVRDYWVVDIPGDQIWIHRDPAGDRYARITQHRRGEKISPLEFPDIVIAADEVLPPRR